MNELPSNVSDTMGYPVDHIRQQFSPDLIVNNQPTALANVSATMGNLVDACTGTSIHEELVSAFDELQRGCAQRLPQAVYLEHIRSRGLNPEQFKVLMAYYITRVTPTYAEIPANLAIAQFLLDPPATALITRNVTDEAGHGDPKKTHPAFLNEMAKVMSEIFGVPHLTFKKTLAALRLQAHESLWKTETGGVDYQQAKELAQVFLEVDEFNEPQTEQEINEQLDTALEYAPLISPAAIHFHRERVRKITGALADINHIFDDFQQVWRAGISLAAQLALREAAASGREGFIGVLTREVIGQYLGHAQDMDTMIRALWWGDIHIDPDFGILYGYKDHSSEDDHAEQALIILLGRIRGPADVLYAIQEMNELNALLSGLWESMVQEMKNRDNVGNILPPKPLSITQAADAKRAMLSGGYNS